MRQYAVIDLQGQMIGTNSPIKNVEVKDGCFWCRDSAGKVVLLAPVSNAKCVLLMETSDNQ